MFDWEFLKHVTETCKNYAQAGGGANPLGLEVSAWNNSIHIVVASLGHRFIFEADTVRGYRATIFEQTNNYWAPCSTSATLSTATRFLKLSIVFLPT